MRETEPSAASAHASSAKTLAENLAMVMPALLLFNKDMRAVYSVVHAAKHDRNAADGSPETVPCDFRFYFQALSLVGFVHHYALSR